MATIEEVHANFMRWSQEGYEQLIEILNSAEYDLIYFHQPEHFKIFSTRIAAELNRRIQLNRLINNFIAKYNEFIDNVRRREDQTIEDIYNLLPEEVKKNRNKDKLRIIQKYVQNTLLSKQKIDFNTKTTDLYVKNLSTEKKRQTVLSIGGAKEIVKRLDILEGQILRLKGRRTKDIPATDKLLKYINKYRTVLNKLLSLDINTKRNDDRIFCFVDPALLKEVVPDNEIDNVILSVNENSKRTSPLYYKEGATEFNYTFGAGYLLSVLNGYILESVTELITEKVFKSVIGQLTNTNKSVKYRSANYQYLTSSDMNMTFELEDHKTTLLPISEKAKIGRSKKQGQLFNIDKNSGGYSIKSATFENMAEGNSIFTTFNGLRQDTFNVYKDNASYFNYIIANAYYADNLEVLHDISNLFQYYFLADAVLGLNKQQHAEGKNKNLLDKANKAAGIKITGNTYAEKINNMYDLLVPKIQLDRNFNMIRMSDILKEHLNNLQSSTASGSFLDENIFNIRNSGFSAADSVDKLRQAKKEYLTSLSSDSKIDYKDLYNKNSVKKIIRQLTDAYKKTAVFAFEFKSLKGA